MLARPLRFVHRAPSPSFNIKVYTESAIKCNQIRVKLLWSLDAIPRRCEILLQSSKGELPVVWLCSAYQEYCRKTAIRAGTQLVDCKQSGSFACGAQLRQLELSTTEYPQNNLKKVFPVSFKNGEHSCSVQCTFLKALTKILQNITKTTVHSNVCNG